MNTCGESVLYLVREWGPLAGVVWLLWIVYRKPKARATNTETEQ